MKPTYLIDMKIINQILIMFFGAGICLSQEDNDNFGMEKIFIDAFKIDKILVLDGSLSDVIDIVNGKMDEAQRILQFAPNDRIKIILSDQLKKDKNTKVFIGLKDTSLNTFLKIIYDQTFLSYELKHRAIVLRRNVIE